MGVTFNDIGDDCEKCPFQERGCKGLVNNGSGPVYPPCAEIDPDIDLNEYLTRQDEYHRKRKEQEAANAARKKEKQLKEETRKKRRRYLDEQCRTEIEEVEMLKKTKVILENSAYGIEIDLHFTEYMSKCGISVGNPDTIKGKLQNAEDSLSQIATVLSKAEERLTKKRKEVMTSEEYKSIR